MPLGKSLGNILDDYFGDQNLNINPSVDNSIQSITTNIPIAEIQIGKHQTRTRFDFEKIQSLAQNVKENGLIHPIMVISMQGANSGQKEYILVSGERRLRACKLLGWKEILAIVKPSHSLNEKQQAMISAMENLQREDLSPIELGGTFKMLMETQKIDEEKLAMMLGHTSQYVKNYLRLLSLGKKAQEALLNREIGEGQARHLVGIPEDKQNQLVKKIVDEDMTVKEIIRFLNKTGKHQPALETKSRLNDLNQDIIRQAGKLAEKFQNSKIKCTGNEEKGRILITWDNS